MNIEILKDIELERVQMNLSQIICWLREKGMSEVGIMQLWHVAFAQSLNYPNNPAPPPPIKPGAA